MSLSDRQRRGAFKLCWSESTLFVLHPVVDVY